MKPFILFITLITLLASCNSKPDETKSVLIHKVEAVQQQIMRQGNISPEEEKVLRSFAELILADRFDSKSIGDVMTLEVVANAPVLPGCENVEAEKVKECFQVQLTELFNTHFDYDIPKGIKDLEAKEVEVVFAVNEKGEVINRKVRDSDIQIQTEAARVLNLIPDMQPAEHDGEKVTVIYTHTIRW